MINFENPYAVTVHLTAAAFARPSIMSPRLWMRQGDACSQALPQVFTTEPVARTGDVGRAFGSIDFTSPRRFVKQHPGSADLIPPV
jgi:hypothetical protein